VSRLSVSCPDHGVQCFPQEKSQRCPFPGCDYVWQPQTEEVGKPAVVAPPIVINSGPAAQDTVLDREYQLHLESVHRLERLIESVQGLRQNVVPGGAVSREGRKGSEARDNEANGDLARARADSGTGSVASSASEASSLASQAEAARVPAFTANHKPKSLRSIFVAVCIGAAVTTTSRMCGFSPTDFVSERIVDREVSTALADGKLFGTEGAVEAFLKTKVSGGATVPGRLEEALNRFGGDAYLSWYNDSQAPEWENVRLAYELLSEAEPTSAMLRARLRYAEAQLLFDSGRYADALTAYQAALAIQPGWALALNGIAKSLIRNDSPVKDHERGVAVFREAMAADPSFVWSFRNLGEYYIQVEQWDEAVVVLEQAAAIPPSRRSVMESLSRARSGLQAESVALSFFDSMLNGDERSVEALLSPAALMQLQKACAGQSIGSCSATMYLDFDPANLTFRRRTAELRSLKQSSALHQLRSTWTLRNGSDVTLCHRVWLERLGTEWKVNRFDVALRQCN